MQPHLVSLETFLLQHEYHQRLFQCLSLMGGWRVEADESRSHGAWPFADLLLDTLLVGAAWILLTHTQAEQTQPQTVNQ